MDGAGAAFLHGAYPIWSEPESAPGLPEPPKKCSSSATLLEKHACGGGGGRGLLHWRGRTFHPKLLFLLVVKITLLIYSLVLIFCYNVVSIPLCRLAYDDRCIVFPLNELVSSLSLAPLLETSKLICCSGITWHCVLNSLYYSLTYRSVILVL